MKPKSHHQSSRLRLLFLASLFFSGLHASHGQTVWHWDADGDATLETGDSGTWDTASLTWREGSAEGTLDKWPNTEPSTNTASFGGFSGFVRLNSDSEDILLNRMVFTTTEYEIEAPASGTAALAFSGPTPEISVGAGIRAYISAPITGTSGFRKIGTGTLDLSGTNSYTGVTTVGTNEVSTPGVVNVFGDQSAANGGWAINGTGVVNFETDSIIAFGAGKNLTTANGGAAAARTLNVFGTVTTSTSSSVQIRGRANFNLDAGSFWTHRGSLIIQPLNSGYAATMNVRKDANFIYEGSANITLAKSTSGNTGGASLTINAGTFTTSKGISNTNAGTGSGTTRMFFSNAGTLKISNDIPSLIIEGTSAFGVVLNAGGGVIHTNGFQTAIEVPLSGVGGLTKAGDGKLTLVGANTYQGATTVAAGELLLAESASIADSSAINIAAGATLDVTALPSFAAAEGKPITFGIHPEGSGSAGHLVAADLDLSAAEILYNLTDTPDDPVYVLATYSGTLTGSDTATVPEAPAGYTLNFAYQGNQIALVGAPSGESGFATWQTLNGTTGGYEADHDNDGVANGIEYFLGGPNANTTGFTPLPDVVEEAGNLSITWTRAADYTGSYGTDFRVETSSTLQDPWTTEALGTTVTITGNQVKYTFPTGTRNFARLVVTGP